jgi:hypothetical protein
MCALSSPPATGVANVEHDATLHNTQLFWAIGQLSGYNALERALASFKSMVSKPSVNQT